MSLAIGMIGFGRVSALANPLGGTVVQGTATITSQGSQLTIKTSDRAQINWSSFNINLGETTTFVQPASSSVVWNRISDPNASQILGNLNANGYVILQNPSGFYIGGQAVLSAHGLLMTTSPAAVPDLAGTGAWQFNARPPGISIINYGQLTTDQGGSVFLLAHDIDNHGSITAPGGKIGLYAGKEVLVSSRPDGRGLSARVTLPEGSVNNEGQLIADAGTIQMHAQVVNQGGLVQANSVRNLNGVIELVASDSVNLGAGSAISAHGDASAGSASQGGFVVVKSDETFTDTATSTTDVSGKNGGRDGVVEVFGSGVTPSTIQSRIDGQATADFLTAGGFLLVNPQNITLGTAASTPWASSPNLRLSDLSSFSKIDLFAKGNIQLSASWSLQNSLDPQGSLSLNAGNNITLNDSAPIRAGTGWGLELTAGSGLAPGTTPGTGADSIFLNGSAYLQTQDGSIDLFAANQVIVNGGAIRTLKGGSINVKTLFGNVNAGFNTGGFTYNFFLPTPTSPYYSVSSTLGGISTAAGGDVTIDAGGDVISYFPNSSANSTIAAADPGTGAFGAEPGNVTIRAGGSVYGHYVLAHGVGSITAGQNVGSAGQNLALSLIKGNWNVSAPNGSIYLQEVRNPNGVFNNKATAGRHLFDYDSFSGVNLDAGLGVFLTCQSLPRLPGDAPPIILPPSLNISAGDLGVALEGTMTLFPSRHGDLEINTSGSFVGTVPGAELSMSDSALSATGQKRWTTGAFGNTDHASVPPELNNTTPVQINVGGDMENISLNTIKQTRITVGGDMKDCNFTGQNLHPGDVTSIDVAGQLYNQGSFSYVTLPHPISLLPAEDRPPNSVNNWLSVLYAALNPAAIANVVVPGNLAPSQYAALAGQHLLFAKGSLDQMFFYNPATQRLTLNGSMSDSLRDILERPVTVLRYGPDGYPIVSHGHFVTDTVTWADASKIRDLYTEGLGAPSLSDASGGYRVGGPGQFNIHAGSISLGNTLGILTAGVGDPTGNRNLNLAAYTRSGASLNVTVDGDLEMLASTIAALGGGNVTVTSTGGAMDLGSQELLDVERQIVKAHNLALGIYTSGKGNVNVTALGDVNIDSSRIAALNGGTVEVKSLEGDVNAGSGGAVAVPVYVYYVDPATHRAAYYGEQVYASGIAALTLVDPSQVPGSPSGPGDITVLTPRGDILASQGGILQEALNGNVSAGPRVTLIAGTKSSGSSQGYVGNIDLGNSGVIGGTVNLDANGSIRGLVISRQNSTIVAQESFNGTVLSGGSANLKAGGTVAGIVIGVGGVSASGGQGITASLVSQNVSVAGGQAQSTLGTTATASAASQGAAAQASTDTRQQLASNAVQEDDDKKKKKGKLPVLTRHVGRVTVILPPGS